LGTRTGPIFHNGISKKLGRQKNKGDSAELCTLFEINEFAVQLGTLGKEAERKSLEQPNDNQFNKRNWAG